jgi:hypothetical protein
LHPENVEFHKKNAQTFEDALDLNAKERSRRFASIDTKGDIKKLEKLSKNVRFPCLNLVPN